MTPSLVQNRLAVVLIRMVSIGLVAMGVTGCSTRPPLPEALQGQSLIVLGFTTNHAEPYQGGTLYKGFVMEALDGAPAGPLSRDQYLLVAPGEHRISGHCYWRLRGVLSFDEDDFTEPGTLTLITRPDTRYTIQSDIDEYKYQCRLTVVETAH